LRSGANAAAAYRAAPWRRPSGRFAALAIARAIIDVVAALAEQIPAERVVRVSASCG